MLFSTRDPPGEIAPHVISMRCARALLPLLLGAARGQQPVRGARAREWASYAASPDTFLCADASRTIPIHQINDDYCDCADASDEPGTSACDNGRFWCMNEGHRGKYVRSNVVNDFVCDCCDGSDEYSSGVGCKNTCLEEGMAARAAAAERLRVVSQGLAQAREWSAAALKEKQQWETDAEAARQALVVKREEATKVGEKKKIAEEAEEAVREEMRAKKAAEEEAARTNAEQDRPEGQVSTAESSSLDAKPSGKDSEAPCPGKSDVMATPLAERWAVWDDPSCGAGCYDTEASDERPHCWKRMPLSSSLDPGSAETATNVEGEEGVEGVEGVLDDQVSDDDGTAAFSDSGLGGGEAGLPAAEDEVTLDGDVELPSEEGEDAIEEVDSERLDYALPDDFDPDKSDDDYTDDRERDGEEDRYGYGGDDLDEPLSTEDDLVSRRESDESSEYTDPEAEKLREEHRAIQQEVDALQNKLSGLERSLSTDYGPDMKFEALSRECFQWSPEGAPFTYEMCPFKTADQKSGGMPTSIGRWAGFQDNYSKMRFENGQTCWNGPSRSLDVSIECGEANKILTVDEPEVCKYAMKFVSPAACTDADLSAAEADVRATVGDAD